MSYICKPATGIDLCVTAFDAACATLQEKTGLPATMLCVGLHDVLTAFDVTTQAKSRMVVVPIPGLPADYWFVCNERGIHWSPGA